LTAFIGLIRSRGEPGRETVVEFEVAACVTWFEPSAMNGLGNLRSRRELSPALRPDRMSEPCVVRLLECDPRRPAAQGTTAARLSRAVERFGCLPLSGILQAEIGEPTRPDSARE
jgi:hypothetical protein